MKRLIKASSSQSDIDSIIKKINSRCREHDVNADYIRKDATVMDTWVLSYVVSGDWKHDHAAFRYCVQEVLEETPDYAVWKIDQHETGEDTGTDSFDADYEVFISPSSEIDNMREMQKLFY